jgi:pyridoxal phosphate enzyme (YggS family)
VSAVPASDAGLAERYARIRAEMARLSPKATLIAVSKGQPAEAIAELYRLGQRDFGENYVQELLAKDAELRARGCTELRWHFIGHLQTNKARALVPVVHAVHSLDTEKLARELARRWRESGRTGKLPVFLHVNIDREATKSGADPAAVPALAMAAASLPELALEGLMCIPDPGRDPRDAFRRLRALEARLHPTTAGKLSMGMSQDYAPALSEGSTHVRIGTVIFGPRPPAK